MQQKFPLFYVNNLFLQLVAWLGLIMGPTCGKLYFITLQLLWAYRPVLHSFAFLQMFFPQHNPTVQPQCFETFYQSCQQLRKLWQTSLVHQM